MKKLISLLLAFGLLLTTVTIAAEAANSDRVVYSYSNNGFFVKENRNAPSVLVTGTPGTYPKWDDAKESFVYQTGGWDGSSPTSEIWKVNVADPEYPIPTQLTTNAVADNWPEWSPDGNKIVWVSEQPTTACDEGSVGRGAIWTMNADGTNKQVLICGDWESTSWSPDGSQIVASWYLGSTIPEENNKAMYDDLYVINVNRVRGSGLGISRLTTDGSNTNERWAEWSPDGDLIAYSDNGGYEIYTHIHVIEPDGSGHRQVTSAYIDSNHPTWSPSSDRIMMGRGSFSSAILYSLDADCNAATQTEDECSPEVYSSEGYVWFPDWGAGGSSSGSPDLRPQYGSNTFKYNSAGTMCRFKVDIENIGPGNAGQSYTGFTIVPSGSQNPIQCNEQTGSILGGTERTVVCDDWFSPGGYDVMYEADVTSIVPESDETNNQMGYEYMYCNPPNA